VPETDIGAMDSHGPRVWGEMTVEVALSVMASADVGHLLVCDEDDQCTGLVTHAQLTTVRDSAAYTDRVRLREVVGHSGPFTRPSPGRPTPSTRMRYQQPETLPMADEYGCAAGVLALSR
jgi:hypothetical protein